jgi:hypothetical protein
MIAELLAVRGIALASETARRWTVNSSLVVADPSDPQRWPGATGGTATKRRHTINGRKQ